MRRSVPLLLLLVGLLAGCGGGDDGGNGGSGGGGGTTAPAEVAGKAVFDEAGCGGCHTYSPAESTGSVGPNLDDANVTFDQAVKQITNGGGGMPSFEGDLSQEEIEAVAQFVSGGGGSSSGDGGGGSAVGPFSP